MIRPLPASLKMLVSICDALSISLDEMVFGSQHCRKTGQEEWERMLDDCSQYEKEILKDVAICVKASLREHNDIRR